MANNRVIVFFDLETTGLHLQTCEIIQLSAVCGARLFDAYACPQYGIQPRASEINGFTVENGELYLHGQQKSTVPVYEMLLSFVGFLRSFNRPVLLAAHNAKRFDAPVLTRVLRQHGLFYSFTAVSSQYLDTLCMGRHLYPGLPSYSQGNLVAHFLGHGYEEHNGLEDSKALEELFNHWSQKWPLPRLYISFKPK